jgi:protoheme IX farnesyltransferase
MVFLEMILRRYFPLIKSRQTILLLITGLAGYMSVRCPVTNWQTLLALCGSLFLTISGSTILNMWYDRDIDALMKRTQKRPLPSGQVSPRIALTAGIVLSAVGISWSIKLSPVYGAIVFLGIFSDVIIYSIWLKRRTCWSIVWGGIAGGMPVLAGRALGVGSIDWVGMALASAVLFWIPTHILTYNMRYLETYRRAGIPTFVEIYGFRVTRIILSVSTVLSALAMGMAGYGIGMAVGFLRIFAILTAVLLVLAVFSNTKPSEKINFSLFKYASIYMFGSMLLVVVTGIMGAL